MKDKGDLLFAGRKHFHYLFRVVFCSGGASFSIDLPR